MLDHLSYGARIDYHTRALKELFSQVQENRNIHIKDIKISRFEDENWKNFLLDTILFAGGEDAYSDEERPLTDAELKFLLMENKFDNLFSQPLKDEGLLQNLF